MNKKQEKALGNFIFSVRDAMPQLADIVSLTVIADISSAAEEYAIASKRKRSQEAGK